jgi:hypothetical protein
MDDLQLLKVAREIDGDYDLSNLFKTFDHRVDPGTNAIK